MDKRTIAEKFGNKKDVVYFMCLPILAWQETTI